MEPKAKNYSFSANHIILSLFFFSTAFQCFHTFVSGSQLSGYSDRSRYEKLRDKLRYFPNEQIIDLDYELAAEYSNLCRTKGIQGSHTDFLICAVSSRLKMKIYTNDKDFIHYSNYLAISVYQD